MIRPTLIQKAWAAEGNKHTIPIPSQIGITDGASSYTDGVPPICMTSLVAGGVPPSGPEANGILNAITAHILLQNSGGRYRFDSVVSAALGGYPSGVVLQSNTGFSEYVNIVDGNTTDFNSNPSSIGVSWLPYAGSAVFVPSGAVLMRLKSSVPSGYLECDGSSLPRSSYSNLFSTIGTTYGAADSTHFNIPDYRGYFLRFWAHGSSIDPDRASRTDRGDGTSGDAVGTKQAQGLLSHAHYWTTPPAIEGSGYAAKMVVGHLYNNQWSTAVPYNMGTTGGTETRPVNINVMYIIKY